MKSSNPQSFFGGGGDLFDVGFVVDVDGFVASDPKSQSSS